MPSWVSYGKLRASYAFVGGDMVPWENNSGFITSSIWNGAGSGSSTLPINEYYQPNTLPNMNLKPSTSSSVEVGADVRFLNNRLGLDVAWYRSIIKDQIIKIPVTMESGVRRAFHQRGQIPEQRHRDRDQCKSH